VANVVVHSDLNALSVVDVFRSALKRCPRGTAG
jgi:hypothetical protein